MKGVSIRRFIAPISVWLLSATLLLLSAILQPLHGQLIGRVLDGLVTLAPVIVIAGVLAGWLTVSKLASRIPDFLAGGTARAVIIGSAAGAITPVCGLGILPLISALQRRGIAQSAIMVFLVSAPVTDPAMLVVTAGILGVPFAVAKAVSAFVIGVGAGTLVAALGTRGHRASIPQEAQVRCASCAATAERPRWQRFAAESLVNTELALRWLTFALILEVLVRHWVPEQWVTASVGAGTWWGIPVAATIGAPLYFDGFAALPLIHGLTQIGMSSGAALALMISGSAVSLYSAVAVFSLVPLRAFLIYLGVAVVGAMACGYAAQFLGLTVIA